MFADRNLLFGMLALHNGIISRDQLLDAFTAWLSRKQTPLGDILREQGALTEEDQLFLDGFVARQVRQHGDAAKSLAALPCDPRTREELSRLPDSDVQASLSSLPPTPGTTPNVSPVNSEESPLVAPGTRYRAVRLHARGGLGEVHVAIDEELRREVALKRIQDQFADDAGSRARFIREAEVTGHLDHPGVVAVHGLVVCGDTGRPEYAMPFLRGDSLSTAIHRFHQMGRRDQTAWSLALRDLLTRFVAVCNAVGYAHSKGVVHRDLKPANVMLGTYGETLVVDWGLAKVLEVSEEQTTPHRPLPGARVEPPPTRLGDVMGTPAYLPPEQARGELDNVGPASDVWSLGAILYAILTGKPPYRGSDAVEKAKACDFPPPRQVNAAAPAALEAVCEKAMAARPEGRYPTARALAADVEHWLADEPVGAHREPALARAGRWARKRRTLVASTAAALLVAVAGLSVGLAVVGGLNRRLDSANGELELALESAEQRRDVAVAVNAFLQHDLLGQADIGNQMPGGEREERNPNITVAALLDLAARKIVGRFQGQEETEAAIRRTIGDTYVSLGNYEQALPHLEQSVRMREARLGADHPDALASKHSLAQLRRDQGKRAEAEALHLEVLKRREARLGADHPDTLLSKNSLSLLYRDQGKRAEAEALCLEVLKQREARLGADHLQTLSSKSNLAGLLSDQGKYDKAEPLYLEVLKQREARLGADHPDTLISKANLAMLYREQGKHGQAEPLYLEVLGHQEKKLGADHPRTLTIKSNLAVLYHAQRKLDKAEALYLEVLKQGEAKLGADHPHTMNCKSNLAGLYRDQKKHGQAEPLFLEVIGHQEKRLGADHRSTLRSKVNLAALYHDQRKLDKAEVLYLEVLRQSEKKFGADHPISMSSRSNLAALYWSMKRLDRSIPLLEQAVEQQRKKLGADHPSTLLTLANLGINYRDAGRPDEGIRCLEDALTTAGQRAGGLPPDLTWIRGVLLDAYEEGKQFAKAEPLHRASLEQARKQFGPEGARTAGAMAQLGLNLLIQKKYADAEKVLRDCLRVREKTQPDDWTTFNTKSVLGEALLGQGRHADAEPLLVEGYGGIKKREAKMPPESRVVRLKEGLERLVALYDATGKKDEAAKYREELDALAKAAKESPKK